LPRSVQSFQAFSQTGISDTHPAAQQIESAPLCSITGTLADQEEPEDINVSVETEDKVTNPSDGGDGVASHLPPPSVSLEPPQAAVTSSELEDDAEPLLWKGDLIRVSERYVSVVQ
jgi:hypothetical protein